ncbi:MAG: outer membrane beta-barrel protein [Pseudolabrys sp.]
MRRHRRPVRAALRLASVAAACAPLLSGVVGSGTALAQTTGAIPGATVAPDRNPKEVSRFERFGAPPPGAAKDTPRVAQQGVRPLEGFSSGAGATGFDATNTGQRDNKFVNDKRGRKTKPKKNTKAVSPAREQPPLGPVTDSGPIGRRPQDRVDAAYASGQPGRPPVGFGPIYTEPKKRKAHDEGVDPYAALGFRKGGMIYYPALELYAGHNSNPGQVTNGNDATLWTVAPELRAQSDWSRHEFRSELRGSYTGYSPDETPTLSRPYFSGRMDGRIDVRRETRIELGARSLVSTDNPGSPNLQAGLKELPIYHSFGGTAGFVQGFNRLELAARGSAERTTYNDSKLTDGTTSSNSDRDYNQYGGTLRASYEYVPGVKPFVEAGIDTRKHDTVPDRSGFNRDSDGLTGKVGTTFELSRLLTGEIAIGYTRRKYDDPALEDLKGLIGNASLVWNASALTTVKLTAASTVGETTVSGVSGILYRDVGVQVDHAFRRWLIGSAKVSFGIDDYVGSTREDKRYSAGVGLTYKFNHMLQLKGEARRDWLRSNIAGNDYTADIFLVGLRFQY